jgi:hypothetical protein
MHSGSVIAVQTTWDVDSKRTRARTSDLTLLRHVPAGGCITAGRWFLEGTRVGVNAAVMQRDEKIFGEDAEESVPERWFCKGAGRMERIVFPVRSSSHIISSHIISSLARSLLTRSVVWWRLDNVYWEECRFHTIYCWSGLTS